MGELKRDIFKLTGHMGAENNWPEPCSTSVGTLWRDKLEWAEKTVSQFY